MQVLFSRAAIAVSLTLRFAGLMGAAGAIAHPLSLTGIPIAQAQPTETPSAIDRQFARAVDFLDNQAPVGLLQAAFDHRDRNPPYEHISLGRYYLTLGYPTEALEMLEVAMVLPGSDVYQSVLLVDESEIYQQLGRYDDAIAVAKQALELIQQTHTAEAKRLQAIGATVSGNSYEKANALYQLGRSYLAKEELDLAVEALTESVRILEQGETPSLQAQASYALSLAYDAQGESEKAAQAAAQAEKIRTRLAQFYQWDVASLDPAQSLEPWDRRLQEMKAAIAELQSAIDTYEKAGNAVAATEGRCYLGNLFQKIGLLELAHQQLEQAGDCPIAEPSKQP